MGSVSTAAWWGQDESGVQELRHALPEDAVGSPRGVRETRRSEAGDLLLRCVGHAGWQGDCVHDRSRRHGVLRPGGDRRQGPENRSPEGFDQRRDEPPSDHHRPPAVRPGRLAPRRRNRYESMGGSRQSGRCRRRYRHRTGRRLDPLRDIRQWNARLPARRGTAVPAPGRRLRPSRTRDATARVRPLQLRARVPDRRDRSRSRPTVPTYERGCSICDTKRLVCSPRPGPTKARRGVMTAPGWRTRPREEANPHSTSRVCCRLRKPNCRAAAGSRRSRRSRPTIGPDRCDFGDIFRIRSDGSGGKQSPRTRSFRRSLRPGRRSCVAGRHRGWPCESDDTRTARSVRVRAVQQAAAGDSGCRGTVRSLSAVDDGEDESCAIARAWRCPLHCLRSDRARRQRGRREPGSSEPRRHHLVVGRLARWAAFLCDRERHRGVAADGAASQVASSTWFDELRAKLAQSER